VSGRAVIVVPCYNEEQRIDARTFIEFARSGQGDLLLVNDGSSDGTADVLARIERAAPQTVRSLSLPQNRGKAEAVRQGLLAALGDGTALVGYADADLSTPFDELVRLREVADQGSAQVVLGARVALLGRHIERSAMRHYFGRVFATAASVILAQPVYDTQCGAKFFRSTDALRAALATPFSSAWAFDVELIGRLLIGAPGVPALPAEDIIEVPLQRWRDVRGSRMRPFDMIRAGLELGLIARALHERKRAVERSG